MRALSKLAQQRDLLMIGDTKLVSYPNLAAMIEARVDFVAPASKAYVGADTLAACDLENATGVDYVAERDLDKPAETRGTYRVTEDTMVITGKNKTDPPLHLRRVFVWSSARSSAAQTARAKKLDRARDDLERLTRGLGGRYYRTERQVNDRIAVIANTRRVAAYLTVTVGTDPERSKPTLAWNFEQSAIDAEAATDGWYALLTNLGSEITATGVFLRYKGQEAPERRYHNFKGPIAVAPMFLKNNRRIEALISVICLALLVFALVERAVRLAIHPAVKLAGLWAGLPAKPTATLIFTALSQLRLVPATDTTPAYIPRPPPLQTRLLELLEIDPRKPR